jgi:Fe-S oxidoreductase
MKMNDEEALLRKMGVDLQSLDSGCCGMAGSFGFEKNNYEVSLAVGSTGRAGNSDRFRWV